MHSIVVHDWKKQNLFDFVALICCVFCVCVCSFVDFTRKWITNTFEIKFFHFQNCEIVLILKENYAFCCGCCCYCWILNVLTDIEGACVKLYVWLYSSKMQHTFLASRSTSHTRTHSRLNGITRTRQTRTIARYDVYNREQWAWMRYERAKIRANTLRPRCTRYFASYISCVWFAVRCENDYGFAVSHSTVRFDLCMAGFTLAIYRIEWRIVITIQ